MDNDLDVSFELLDARGILKQEFQRRLSSRPRYSLRAFARVLKISPATLSLVFSGKLKVSKNLVRKMTVALDLTPEVTKQLLGGHSETQSDEQEVQQITWDIFTVFSEWYHFAILSLLEIEGSTLDPRWIARKLSISSAEATMAVERLKGLGLIDQVNGRWRQTGGKIQVPRELSTTASRKFQRQLLQKAIDSLDNDEASTRDITSVTFAMNEKMMEWASDQITDFRRKLTTKLERSKKLSAVYNLTIQLYPVSKPDGRTK